MAEENSAGKPADFFVGLVDFFAILLPGAILTFFLYKCIEHEPQGLSELLPFLPSEKWGAIAVFALLAYVLGHLLFVIGSLSLDPLYDWWKQIFPSRESLQTRANEVAQKRCGGLTEIIGEFHCVSIEARLRSAAAAAELDRLEADQKFFRGLILVLLFAWPLLLWVSGNWNWKAWLGLLLLLGVPAIPFKVVKKCKCVRNLLNIQTVEIPSEEEIKKSKKRLAQWQMGFLISLVLSWSVLFIWTAFEQPLDLKQPHRKQSAGTTTKEGAQSVAPNAGPGTALKPAPMPNSGTDAAGQEGSVKKPAVAALLGFALALSAVRFVQQRLKYTVYAYRAYLILSLLPEQAKTSSGGEHSGEHN